MREGSSTPNQSVVLLIVVLSRHVLLKRRLRPRRGHLGSIQ